MKVYGYQGSKTGTSSEHILGRAMKKQRLSPAASPLCVGTKFFTIPWTNLLGVGAPHAPPPPGYSGVKKNSSLPAAQALDSSAPACPVQSQQATAAEAARFLPRLQLQAQPAVTGALGAPQACSSLTAGR